MHEHLLMVLCQAEVAFIVIEELGIMRKIQSAITCVSFPDDILDLKADIAYAGSDRALDLDFLTNPNPYDRDDPLTWSAPKHLVEGDILFFYHTRSALPLIRRAVRHAGEADGDMHAVLHRALDYFDRFGGSIFGCAEITQPASFEIVGRHFNWRSQAPIQGIHTFGHPLHLRVFEKFIPPPHGNTIIPLTAPQFNRLKTELQKHNRLPPYLRRAVGRDLGLNQVTAKNWRRVACAADIRFRYEEQLRTYFANHLLREIKDVGSPLLEECECYRESNGGGQADYFVKLNGRWTPVEAKISVLAEKDLFSQIRKYLGVQRIRPRKGDHAGETFLVDETAMCLVIDQLGLYILHDDGFVDCAPGMPRWSRDSLPPRDVLREGCIAAMASPSTRSRRGARSRRL